MEMKVVSMLIDCSGSNACGLQKVVIRWDVLQNDSL